MLAILGQGHWQICEGILRFALLLFNMSMIDMVAMDSFPIIFYVRGLRPNMLRFFLCLHYNYRLGCVMENTEI